LKGNKMSDTNKVILIGRLTRYIELSYTNSGTAVGKFSLAVNRRIKKDGQWEGEANFFDVTLWGKAAEALKSYLTKGRQVCVTGELRQNRWNDQQGNSRSKVEIVAREVQLLGNSQQETSSGQSQQDDFEDDPPF
jgi:single-strand DNA-binding protein